MTPTQAAILPQWIAMCVENENLKHEFDRLRGTNISLKGSLIELDIDIATGRIKSDTNSFVAFCVDLLERT
jgi:hypothetical protein